MSCKQDSFCETSLRLRASRVTLCYSTLSQGHQHTACKQQTTTHPNTQSKHNSDFSNYFQAANTCVTNTLHSRGKELPLPALLLSSKGTGILPIQGQEGLQLKPGRLIPTNELFLHVPVLTQLPLDTRSSPISIKLIISTRWMIPQKTRFLSLQPQ